MEKNIDEIDFSKGDGLVPVIVQDVNSKEVLTLAYSNKESLELTKKLPHHKSYLLLNVRNS